MRKSGYYYDIRNRLLRRKGGKLFFAVGVRRAGKTYSSLDWVIKRYFKHKEKFIWCRLLCSEIKLTASHDFYKDLEKIYPDHTFLIKSVKGITYLFIDDEEVGIFLALRQWESVKAVKLSSYKNIVVDEFLKTTMREEKNYDPVTALFGLIDTVDDNRDEVRCVCLANFCSYSNPFFMALGIEIPFGYIGIWQQGGIVVEVVYDKGFAEERAESGWGQIMLKTQYGRHSIYNESLVVQDGFIFDSLPPKVKRLFDIRYFDDYIHVYEDEDRLLYITRSKLTKNTTLLGMRHADAEAYELPAFKTYKNGIYYTTIDKARKNAEIRYESLQTKEMLLQFMI